MDVEKYREQRTDPCLDRQRAQERPHILGNIWLVQLKTGLYSQQGRMGNPLYGNKEAPVRLLLRQTRVCIAEILWAFLRFTTSLW